MTNRRTGRRPGTTDTREAILRAARIAFSERGFDAATVREIAREAGVDPALVHHYFGAKEKLFLATIDAPLDPRDVATTLVGGDPDTLGERLAERVLALWDSPAGESGIALVRTSMQHDWSAKLAREFILSRAVRPIVASVEPNPDLAEWRANLIASQMVGLAISRYILKMEPLASADPHSIVASIAPTIQRYLTGDIPVPRQSRPT